MNPLDQLRDIHLPDAVSWWPLAIGWWLVAALLLGMMLFFVWRLQRSKQQRHRVNHVMQSLDALDDDTDLSEQEWLQTLSALLRRIVINLHGRQATAGLVGKQWLEYLDQSTKNKDFSEGGGKLLATHPYQTHASYDRQVLLQLVRKWVKAQAKIPSDQESTRWARSKAKVDASHG